MARSTENTPAPPRPPAQIVGNSGLYYVCYRLSLLGWNVLPTSRNARGIDIVCYSMDGKRVVTLQVKSLTKRAPVPLGGSLDRLMADFWVIATRLGKAPETEPACYVMTPRQVRNRAHKGVKDGKVSYWLQPNDYDTPAFREKWDRIGLGY